MLRQLAKIANRLDSLGLTKEADILDRYLEKSASMFEGLIGTVPPPTVQATIKKWIGPRASFGGSDLKDPGNFSVQLGQVFDWIGMELDRDGGNDFYMWYMQNINSPGTTNYTSGNVILASDLMKLSDRITEYATSENKGWLYPNSPWSNAQNRALATAQLVKLRTPGVGAPKEKVSPEGAPVAQMGGNVAPKIPPVSPPAPEKTTAPLTDWQKYEKATPYGAAVRLAWHAFTRIDPPEIGKDDSFAAFKKWYLDAKKESWGGADKSAKEVIAILKREEERIKSGDFTTPAI